MPISALRTNQCFREMMNINTNKFVPILIVLALCQACAGQTSEEYVQQLEDHRMKIDTYMRTSNASPFVNANYNGLQFFDIDRSYSVVAKVDKLDKLAYLNIPTSDGKVEKFLKLGYAVFNLKDQELKLLLLKKAGALGRMEQVFIPFSDFTNGESTYGGGRYLDVPYSNTPNITLDFNKAYNPYCEYNTKFSCPLPPIDNKLRIAIEAGEKSYIP
jgi:uncharacterized protein (DUF1684 family)